MRCSILAVSMVAGLSATSMADRGRGEPAASSAASSSSALIDPLAAEPVIGPREDEEVLDPIGEGTVIGEHARLESANGPIHVWTPLGYARETAAIVVYVHGYGIDVDEAWWAHGLPEQFGLAQINAMFIACEAPTDSADDVKWTSLTKLLETVEAAGHALPKGRVTAVGHSGAYRTFEHWVRDARMDTLAMLDAGYGNLYWVRSWILGKAGRRLINIGDDTIMFTDYLHRFLPRTVTLQGFESLAERSTIERLTREPIVYIRSSIGHYPIASGPVAMPSVLRILGAPGLPPPAPLEPPPPPALLVAPPDPFAPPPALVP